MDFNKESTEKGSHVGLAEYMLPDEGSRCNQSINPCDGCSPSFLAACDTAASSSTVPVKNNSDKTKKTDTTYTEECIMQPQNRIQMPSSSSVLMTSSSPMEVVPTITADVIGRYSGEGEQQENHSSPNNTWCGVCPGVGHETVSLQLPLKERAVEKISEKVLLPPPPPPPSLEQHALVLQCHSPRIKDIQLPNLDHTSGFSKKDDANADAWEAFLALRKETEDSVLRMTSFYDQMVKIRFTHEQESASYRDATERMTKRLQQELDDISAEHKNALLNIEHLKSLLTQKTKQMAEYEAANYTLNMQLKGADVRCMHAEDRAKVAEAGQSMLALRQRDLEMSLKYATDSVKTLRERLSNADIEKVSAMQEQYRTYEENQRNVIEFYNKREKDIILGFNNIVMRVHEMMNASMKEREEHLCCFWQGVVRVEQHQQQENVKKIGLLIENEARKYQEKLNDLEIDKQKQFDQYRAQIIHLEKQHMEREHRMINDITRRERDLTEREERMRVQCAEKEQDANAALMAKEVELRAYYQKITEDMRIFFDKEREKLYVTFREQVQELSDLHLNQERELEQLHREKEREILQRYRVAKYELDDHRDEVDIQKVSLQTQSALLSKFDTIEARQRERAEKARATLKKDCVGNTSSSP